METKDSRGVVYDHSTVKAKFSPASTIIERLSPRPVDLKRMQRQSRSRKARRARRKIQDIQQG